MFAELRIAPLRIWYEDAVAAPDAVARQVADYLGVAIDPAAAVNAPQIRKQSAGDAQRWAEAYRGVKSAA
jgi:LPS sulfotransferase NodH